MSTPEETQAQELSALEAKLDQLLSEFRDSKAKNKELQSKFEELSKEKAELVEKNNLTKKRVEMMIARLKAMESDT